MEEHAKIWTGLDTHSQVLFVYVTDQNVSRTEGCPVNLVMVDPTNLAAFASPISLVVKRAMVRKGTHGTKKQRI